MFKIKIKKPLIMDDSLILLLNFNAPEFSRLISRALHTKFNVFPLGSFSLFSIL